MSNHPQPDNQRPEPDPAAPPPSAPDGTSPPSPPSDGTSPASGPPDNAGSPSYAPGRTPLPDPRPEPDYPPTAQFPTTQFPITQFPNSPVNYAPPGHVPDYGQAQQPPGYQPPTGYDQTSGYLQPPGYEPPPGYHQSSGYQQPHAYQQPEGYQQAAFPPPGYSAPGYPAASGYQQSPGYSGQPGYPAADPAQGQPPRKSSTPLIAVIVAVTLLLCGGVATAGVLIARNVADRAKEAIKPITELPRPTVEPTLPSLPGWPSDAPGGSGSSAAPGGTGRKITVTYEVSGDGPAEIMYVAQLGTAPTRLDDVKLPWKFSAEVETPALLSIIAMRADSTEGTISCRALVDGDEVTQRTSGGGTYATASCTHLALD